MALHRLGTNFLLREDSVGQNRARASHAKLQELNPLGRVECREGPLGALRVADFDLVIASVRSAAAAAALNEACRASNVSSFFTSSHGEVGWFSADLNAHKFSRKTFESGGGGGGGGKEEHRARFPRTGNSAAILSSAMPTRKRRKVTSAIQASTSCASRRYGRYTARCGALPPRAPT